MMKTYLLDGKEVQAHSAIAASRILKDLEAPAAVISTPLFYCPFCGKVPKMHEQYHFRLMADLFQVQCGCGCYSPRYNTPDEANNWWNNRQDKNRANKL